MKKIIGFFLVLAAFFTRSNADSNKNESNNIKENQKERKEQKMRKEPVLLSKKEIDEKLKKLKEAPLPKELSLGAECYEVAQRPDRIEYICHICGNKTYYTHSSHFEMVDNISYIRTLMEPLKKYKISLDERALCSTCKKEITEKSLCIQIPYLEEKEKTHRRCEITADDLRLMQEFLNGEYKHRNTYDEETPLIKYIERLESLFGVRLQ